MPSKSNLLCPWIALVGLASLVSAGDPPPLTFYAPFDGTLEATARGSGNPVSVVGPVTYRPGRVGQALLCGEGGASITYSAAKNLRASCGTLEMWVCPLDWTGTEDEFHVFLEAINPGWLVFYRYYQGGLLTLMGTDGQHYRAAAGPPFQWKPGEWHHVAGVWRAKRLEVYVDGKRAGVNESPVIPEQLAETFVVGDRPWHVPRNRQTLIDELKLYAAPLDEVCIASAARGEPMSYQPKMILDASVDPDRLQLNVGCDAAGIIAEESPGHQAQLAIVPRGSDGPLVRGTITEFAHDVGHAELAIDTLPPGDFDVQAQLANAAGSVLAKSSQPLHNPFPPVWSGNTLGVTDKVLSPWEPLQAKPSAVNIGSSGPRYTFGTFLKEASSDGVPLLSQDVRLEAVVSGQTTALTGEVFQLNDARETHATWTGSAEGAGLQVRVQHTVEYDGFTWSDLVVAPARPVKVDELRLTWTMPTSAATLLHADAQRWSENPAGQLPPQGWTSPLVPFFWLGNEQRGLSWYVESARNWRPATNKPTIEVVPDGSEVRVIVRLIAEPSTIEGELAYGFGMMATPSSPRSKTARHWRMAPAVRPTFDIVWPNDCLKWYGYPEPVDADKFRERVRAAHAQHIQVVPYVNLNFMSAGAPEWQYFGSRWADPARVVTPSDVAAMGHPSMGTCPAVRDWQDFILFRINEMIERYEIDGIYIDCWSPFACSVGACGVPDATGKVHPTWPIRSYREILRRVDALFHEKRPNPLIMVHMSSEVVIPMLSFTDTILDGEQFASDKLGDDYLDILPPDKFRAEFLGRNWGPVAFFLPEFRGAAAASGTPNLAAYLLLHDVQPWPIWSDTATWNRLYDQLDAHGFADATFLPYWSGSGVRAPSQVLVSTFAGTKEAILAVVNNGEATEATIELDLQRLGLSRIDSASDVLTNEALKVANATVVIPLARHQGRVLLVRP